MLKPPGKDPTRARLILAQQSRSREHFWFTNKEELLERRRIRDRRIKRAENADGRIERFERLLLDDRGNAFANAAGARVLVNNLHAIAVARDRENRMLVERREAAEVEHRGFDAFRGQLLGNAHAVMHVGAVRNHRDV